VIPLTPWHALTIRGVPYYQRFGLDAGLFYAGVVSQCVRRPEEVHLGRYWLRLGVAFTSTFALGSQHTYYDGPHCSFSLGWLHISWEGHLLTGDCAKCHGGA
jgi:hypothetical protein